jgi:hypothetical protein
MNAMKYSIKILTVVCAAFFIASCTPEKQPLGFGISKTEIVMGADGGTEIVEILSSGKWRAEVGGIAVDKAPWITVSPANGRGSVECSIKVDSTLLASNERQAVVRFVSDESGVEPLMLDVSQYGYDKMIALSTTEVELPDQATTSRRVFDVEVTSTVDFKVEMQSLKEGEPVSGAVDWIRNDNFDFDLDRGARPRTVKIRFKWDSNIYNEQKGALISFVPTDPNEVLDRQDALTVTQSESPEITNDRRGDSIALVFILRGLNRTLGLDEGQNMNHWDFVTLWQDSDKDDEGNPIPAEKVGRVRRVEIISFNTYINGTVGDELPFQFKYLKHIEEISLIANSNKLLKSLGTEMFGELTGLKRLTLDNVGISRLDDNFTNLVNLEYLNLAGNNLSKVPEILTPENFPNLEHLDLVGNVRYTITDFSNPQWPADRWGGFYEDKFPEQLLRWGDKLTYLGLSNNYFYGEIPDMEDYDRYTENDPYFEGRGDTLNFAWQNRLPRVLPNLKVFSINLNYLRGDIPDWLLYHPHLDEWNPTSLIFNQHDARYLAPDLTVPGFDNVPTEDQYYEAYPLKEPDYE